MPLFICDKCECIENTALGRYWARDMKDCWKDGEAGKALCSECAPKEFRDGTPTRWGKWHGRFEKRKAGDEDRDHVIHPRPGKHAL